MRPRDEQPARLDQPVGERDHAQGPQDAPVTLVEYGDYECPYCGQVYPVTKQLQERLGDRLRFVFRNYPLDSVHPRARPAAEAAEAAGSQGKFWEYHDVLYENQQDLDDESLKRYAADLGLDEDRFEEDLAEHRYLERIEEDLLSGIQSRVEGTPMFFINGVRYESAYDFETLLAALEDAARR
jgi:protein-disulfide isomerase